VFSLPLSLDKKYIAVAICGDGTEGWYFIMSDTV
jgi:hypothetical protein